MATPFPDPEESRKKRPLGARRSQTAAALLAPSTPLPPPPPAQHIPTKLSVDQHAAPGPSGIKQCYRTVKCYKRLAVLQGQSPPSTSPSPSTSISTSSTPKKQHQHACKQCHKRFNSPGKLSQHMLSHTGELPFTCQRCEKRFNSKFKLLRHGLIHSETRPFSCNTCQKTFHRKDHLVNHERTHNPTKEPYKCNKANCNKQYTSQLSFRKHLALHSAEEGNLECKICYKKFEKKEDIVYHLKVHAGSRTVKNENDKKFKCNHCGRKFFTGKDVRRHLVVHTGSRDFPCQFCKQQFGRKDHLVRHMKKAHPNETWQSSTPSVSSTPQTSITQKPPPVTSKKGKGEGKKSKTKPEIKYSSKGYQQSEEICIKQEQLPVAIIEGGLYDVTSQPSSALQKRSLDITQQPIFLPEEIGYIKPEPIIEGIKIEKSTPSVLMYEPMPSTSKDAGTLTSVEKFQEFASGFPDFIMHSFGIQPERIHFIPEPEIPGVEPEKAALELLEQPIESILEEESEIQFQQQQHIQPLPTFKEAFPSSAQSQGGAPPPHDPK